MPPSPSDPFSGDGQKMAGDSGTNGWLGDKFQRFHQAHERLKNRVHTAWRYHLPHWGRFVMGCVYFSVTIVLGYYASMWAISKSEATVHERLGSGLGGRVVEGNSEKGMYGTQTNCNSPCVI